MQPKDLGKNIKELRMAKKLIQQEFAELLIVAPQTISKWERGVSCPDVFYLQKMSKILDVSILEFLEDDEKDIFKNSLILNVIDGLNKK